LVDLAAHIELHRRDLPGRAQRTATRRVRGDVDPEVDPDRRAGDLTDEHGVLAVAQALQERVETRAQTVRGGRHDDVSPRCQRLLALIERARGGRVEIVDDVHVGVPAERCGPGGQHPGDAALARARVSHDHGGPAGSQGSSTRRRSSPPIPMQSPGPGVASGRSTRRGRGWSRNSGSGPASKAGSGACPAGNANWTTTWAPARIATARPGGPGAENSFEIPARAA